MLSSLPPAVKSQKSSWPKSWVRELAALTRSKMAQMMTSQLDKTMMSLLVSELATLQRDPMCLGGSRRTRMCRVI